MNRKKAQNLSTEKKDRSIIDLRRSGKLQVNHQDFQVDVHDQTLLSTTVDIDPEISQRSFGDPPVEDLTLLLEQQQQTG